MIDRKEFGFLTGCSISMISGALILSSVVFGSPSLAGEKQIFRDRPPTNEEISNILFPEAGQVGMGKTRGISRGIVFTGRKPEEKAAPKKPREFGMALKFDFDSAAIKPESRPYLDRLGEVLRGNRAIEFSIVIVGHTDGKGSEAYNLALSQKRADAVKSYLVMNHSVDAGRLVTKGRGESEPVDSANPESAENRRVEFQRAE